MNSKMVHSPTPLLGFAAWSGTGKTTLLEQIIPILTKRGVRIAAIKHTHHDFDIDQPGKDSYKLRKSGANQVLVASSRRWALMNESSGDVIEPDLQQLLPKLDHDNLDLVLIEGFKHEPIPRIELHRSTIGKPLLYPDDKQIIAIAISSNEQITTSIHMLDLDNSEQIADFIETHILHRKQTT